MSVIQIDSLSFTSIITNLTDYFKNQSDSATWTDFYESSTGRIFIRLLAAFGAFISYLCTVNRRETFLSYAQDRSSNIAISQNDGYSVSRGNNEIVEIRFTPVSTEIIPAYTSVGTVNDLELITSTELTLTSGVSTVAKFFIGTIGTENISITTENITPFRFTSTKVSNDLILKLNGSEVPYSKVQSDLAKDKYVCISNSLGAVDVSYLQTGNYKYQPADVLSITYIVLAKPNAYSITNISLDVGVVSSLINIYPYVAPESIDSIKINAPLFHETQVKTRGRYDYLKRFKSLGRKFNSVGSTDFSSGIVRLSYVNKDHLLLTDNDTSEILQELAEMRLFGIPLPEIKHPEIVFMNLDFIIKKIPNITTTETDITIDITNNTGGYEKTLTPTVDLEQLERLMDDYTYLKRSRVAVKSSVRTSSNLYRLGDFISLNNLLYKVEGFTSPSLTTEPTWNYTIGSLVTDGKLVWKCSHKYYFTPRTWKTINNYKIGDLVIPTSTNELVKGYMFECVDILRTSSASTPNFNQTVGEITYDNELIWITKAKLEANSAWQASHVYSLGASVKDNSYSYECIGYRGSSSVNQPTFKTVDNLPIFSIDIPNNAFLVEGDQTALFKRNDIVSIEGSTTNNAYFTVNGTSMIDGNTRIHVVETVSNSDELGTVYLDNTYTIDGDILWQYYDPNTLEFTYGWNQYLKITNSVTINE